MASEWEMGLGGVEYFGMGATFSNAANITTPITTASGVPPGYLYGLPSATDSLRIDDLLDFSNQEAFPAAAAAAAGADNLLLPPPEPSSAVTGGSSSSDFRSNLHGSFTDELYFPSEEAAELEWLSTFVDDSFSDVVPYPPSSSAANLPPPAASAEAGHLRADVSAGCGGGGAAAGRGARSKRGRAAWSAFAGPAQAQAQGQSSPSSSSSSSSSEFPSSKPRPGNGRAGRKNDHDQVIGVEGGVRRCTHCASEKTPQWRTGPLGPKTLCNACGVRFKSGRLVPEYRPAASPTFVLTQHSNSHRKVMELRRQKELLLLRHRDTSSSAAVAAAAAELSFHDYGVC